MHFVADAEDHCALLMRFLPIFPEVESFSRTQVVLVQTQPPVACVPLVFSVRTAIIGIPIDISNLGRLFFFFIWLTRSFTRPSASSTLFSINEAGDNDGPSAEDFRCVTPCGLLVSPEKSQRSHTFSYRKQLIGSYSILSLRTRKRTGL